VSQRQSNLVWLRDMLEHLVESQQQLEWTEDDDTIRVLTETMLRDLDSCRRICENLHRRTQSLRQAV